jgi:stearoyl-CoA desaturase (delta-9 desaturase)
MSTTHDTPLVATAEAQAVNGEHLEDSPYSSLAADLAEKKPDAPEAARSRPQAVRSSLLPKPHRSLPWILYNSARGTWFLILIHLGALGVFFTGTTWLDWLVFPAIMYARGLITTIGYHRYFAHRSFKTSRVGQFLLACLCCANLQRGPLWWAAIHRHHHRHSDEVEDAHSPLQGGFLWSYAGWMFATLEEPDWGSVRDLRRYPELVWLERFWLVPGLLLAGACWLVGGWSMVWLDFCLTAVIAVHGAAVINSLSHMIGSRRYPTPDQSRNSLLLAIFTLGDGWHNNHHHYPHAAQAGFFWWEIDGSFRLIRLLERLGLVWGVRRVPAHKLLPAAHPPEA